MAITIGSNIGSLFVQRQLDKSTRALSSVYERLSSGLRINRASDDAAGLSIASRLTAERRIAMQAIRNVNDGISALNIAEAALSELSNITLRHKELAEQAANGTYSLSQRLQMHGEAKALTDEFNRIAAGTSFNGINLLTADAGSLQVQAGTGAANQLTADLSSSLSRVTGDGTIRSGAVSYSIGTGNGPTDVVTADFNGDGIQDALVANIGNSTRSLLIGYGDGTFQGAVTVALGLQPVGLIAADFNNDGSMDFAVSGAGGGAKVYLNDGRANFTGLANLSGGGGNYDLVAVDLDNNNILDLVMSDWSGNVLSYLGKGDGTFFAPTTTTSGGNPFSIATGDFNGDGLADIVSSDQATGAGSLLLGNGNGTFQARVTFAQTDGGSSVSAGDYNGDGFTDVAISDGLGLNVYLSNGKGSFSKSQGILTPGQPRGILSEDLNGDGILDLAWTNGANNTGSIALGNGSGTFQISSTFATGGYPVDLATADLNRDGALDLVTANSTGQSATALLGNTRKVTSMQYLDLTTRTGALEALGTIEATRERVSSQRSALGASQSRLNVAANHLATYWQECGAAEARILNSDVAADAAELARLQILQGAASAILAQANQGPQIALMLLKTAS